MDIPLKTLENGFSLPVYGFGSNKIGSRSKTAEGNPDINIIKQAIDKGVRHFDTAESYTGGLSEKTIGKAIKGYKRKDLIIGTKVSPLNLSYKKLMEAAKNSLKRLETDYIDLYMLHFPNKHIPVAETMRAMDQLVKEGIIRYIGTSNYNLDQFREAQSNCENTIVLNQVPFSLINRKFQDSGFIDHAMENDIMGCCWWPLESGRLTERGIGILDRMCDKYNRTPSQIALNWLISQKNIVTISGTRDMEHLEENLGSLGWQLDEEDIRLLDRDFPIKENSSIAEDSWSRFL